MALITVLDAKNHGNVPIIQTEHVIRSVGSFSDRIDLLCGISGHFRLIFSSSSEVYVLGVPGIKEPNIFMMV